MGAGASAPTGVGSSPAPIVAPPVSTPIVPATTAAATPSSMPQGGKGGPTAAGTPAPAPVTQSVSPVAPTAPQQPYVNPYMQTYGQSNTPQQQMFNRFPQRFQQPQSVVQPAQGPVYADQSLNATDNQPQQPQYGRFGRGFMPQNRGGYDRQLDQLRGQGQYGQQGSQAAFINSLLSGQQPIAGQPSAPVGGKGGGSSPTGRY
jgi:hypothetical protein